MATPQDRVRKVIEVYQTLLDYDPTIAGGVSVFALPTAAQAKRLAAHPGTTPAQVTAARMQLYNGPKIAAYLVAHSDQDYRGTSLNAAAGQTNLAPATRFLAMQIFALSQEVTALRSEAAVGSEPDPFADISDTTKFDAANAISAWASLGTDNADAIVQAEKDWNALLGEALQGKALDALSPLGAISGGLLAGQEELKQDEIQWIVQHQDLHTVIANAGKKAAREKYAAAVSSLAPTALEKTCFDVLSKIEADNAHKLVLKAQTQFSTDTANASLSSDTIIGNAKIAVAAAVTAYTNGELAEFESEERDSASAPPGWRVDSRAKLDHALDIVSRDRVGEQLHPFILAAKAEDIEEKMISVCLNNAQSASNLSDQIHWIGQAKNLQNLAATASGDARTAENRANSVAADLTASFLAASDGASMPHRAESERVVKAVEVKVLQSAVSIGVQEIGIKQQAAIEVTLTGGTASAIEKAVDEMFVALKTASDAVAAETTVTSVPAVGQAALEVALGAIWTNLGNATIVLSPFVGARDAQRILEDAVACLKNPTKTSEELIEIAGSAHEALKLARGLEAAAREELAAAATTPGPTASAAVMAKLEAAFREMQTPTMPGVTPAASYNIALAPFLQIARARQALETVTEAIADPTLATEIIPAVQEVFRALDLARIAEAEAEAAVAAIPSGSATRSSTVLADLEKNIVNLLNSVNAAPEALFMQAEKAILDAQRAVGAIQSLGAFNNTMPLGISVEEREFLNINTEYRRLTDLSRALNAQIESVTDAAIRTQMETSRLLLTTWINQLKPFILVREGQLEALKATHGPVGTLAEQGDRITNAVNMRAKQVEATAAENVAKEDTVLDLVIADLNARAKAQEIETGIPAGLVFHRVGGVLPAHRVAADPTASPELVAGLTAEVATRKADAVKTAETQKSVVVTAIETCFTAIGNITGPVVGAPGTMAAGVVNPQALTAKDRVDDAAKAFGLAQHNAALVELALAADATDPQIAVVQGHSETAKAVLKLGITAVEAVDALIAAQQEVNTVDAYPVGTSVATIHANIMQAQAALTGAYDAAEKIISPPPGLTLLPLFATSMDSAKVLISDYIKNIRISAVNASVNYADKALNEAIRLAADPTTTGPVLEAAAKLAYEAQQEAKALKIELVGVGSAAHNAALATFNRKFAGIQNQSSKTYNSVLAPFFKIEEALLALRDATGIANRALTDSAAAAGIVLAVREVFRALKAAQTAEEAALKAVGGGTAVTRSRAALDVLEGAITGLLSAGPGDVLAPFVQAEFAIQTSQDLVTRIPTSSLPLRVAPAGTPQEKTFNDLKTLSDRATAASIAAKAAIAAVGATVTSEYTTALTAQVELAEALVAQPLPMLSARFAQLASLTLNHDKTLNPAGRLMVTQKMVAHVRDARAQEDAAGRIAVAAAGTIRADSEKAIKAAERALAAQKTAAVTAAGTQKDAVVAAIEACFTAIAAIGDPVVGAPGTTAGTVDPQVAVAADHISKTAADALALAQHYADLVERVLATTGDSEIKAAKDHVAIAEEASAIGTAAMAAVGALVKAQQALDAVVAHPATTPFAMIHADIEQAHTALAAAREEAEKLILPTTAPAPSATFAGEMGVAKTLIGYRIRTISAAVACTAADKALDEAIALLTATPAIPAAIQAAVSFAYGALQAARNLAAAGTPPSAALTALETKFNGVQTSTDPAYKVELVPFLQIARAELALKNALENAKAAIADPTYVTWIVPEVQEMFKAVEDAQNAEEAAKAAALAAAGTGTPVPTLSQVAMENSIAAFKQLLTPASGSETVLTPFIQAEFAMQTSKNLVNQIIAWTPPVSVTPGTLTTEETAFNNLKELSDEATAASAAAAKAAIAVTATTPYATMLAEQTKRAEAWVAQFSPMLSAGSARLKGLALSDLGLNQDQKVEFAGKMAADTQAARKEEGIADGHALTILADLDARAVPGTPALTTVPYRTASEAIVTAAESALAAQKTAAVGAAGTQADNVENAVNTAFISLEAVVGPAATAVGGTEVNITHATNTLRGVVAVAPVAVNDAREACALVTAFTDPANLTTDVNLATAKGHVTRGEVALALGLQHLEPFTHSVTAQNAIDAAKAAIALGTPAALSAAFAPAQQAQSAVHNARNAHAIAMGSLAQVEALELKVRGAGAGGTPPAPHLGIAQAMIATLAIEAAKVSAAATPKEITTAYANTLSTEQLVQTLKAMPPAARVQSYRNLTKR